MGRGCIFAVTLAALGAVFLQGCGKAAPPPAPVVAQVVTTLTAAAEKGATALLVTSNVGFGIDSKVAITDPASKLTEINGIAALPSPGSVTLMAALQNDYAVGSELVMNEVDEGKITGIEDVTTSPEVIKTISPSYIRPGTSEQTLKLTGSAVLGDNLFFTKEGVVCDKQAETTVSAVKIVDATNSEVTAVFEEAGTYKVCYTQVGRTDDVEQTAAGAEMKVQETTESTDITALAPHDSVVAGTTDKEFTLTGTIPADGKGAFVLGDEGCPLASSILSWSSIDDIGIMTVGTVPAAGTYKLCLAGSQMAPTKQQDVTLTVDAPPESTD